MHIGWDLIDFNHLIPILSDYIIYPSITIILCLLSVFVVLGNSLVVSAIWHENQLHSVTNYLIASLAAADCLVGLVVMPFSIISEIIIGSWTFGPTWCDLWHSFDVLASTASIMNLCAISLDRYLAITNPISYPTKMTPKRVALLIVSLWTCSSLISFPAIAWWRAVGDGPLQQFVPSKATTTTIPETNDTNTLISPTTIVQADEFSSYKPTPIEGITQNQRFGGEERPLSSQQQQQMLMTTATATATPLYRCVFTDDTYYLLFSSIVSFYGPLCVMLYAYYRIYTAAVQQTRFLKYGSKQVMIGKNKRNKRSRYFSEHSNQGLNEKYGLSETICDGISTTDNTYDTRLVLRAHRGGGGGCTEFNNTRGATHNSSFNVNHNGSSLSSSSKTEQRRRDNSSNSDFMMQSSVDEEQRDGRPTGTGHGRIVGSGPSSSGDFSQSSGERHQLGFDSNQVAALNRQNRIEQIINKRDRIRIGSQRFESNIIHENGVINYTTEESNAVHQLGKGNLERGNSNEASFNERSILERKSETLVNSDINNPVRQPEILYIKSNHCEPMSERTKPAPDYNNELQSNQNAKGDSPLLLSSSSKSQQQQQQQQQQKQKHSREQLQRQQLRANVCVGSISDKSIDDSWTDIQLVDGQLRPTLCQTKKAKKISSPVTTSTSTTITPNRATETRIKTSPASRDPSTAYRDRLGHNRIIDRDNPRRQLKLVEEDETSGDFYDDSASSDSDSSTSSGKSSSDEGEDGRGGGAGGGISISVSSGSYGTGSIASVLVRPQPSARDNLATAADCETGGGGGSDGDDHNGGGEEEIVQVAKSIGCDIDDSHSSNSKLRRALSVGDAERKPGAKWGVDIESALEGDNKCQQHNGMNHHHRQHHYHHNKSHHTPHNVIMNGTDQLKTVAPISGIVNKGRHRASCGNAIGDLKPAARTLDIRSWVRIGRSKQTSKCDNVDHNHRRHYHQHEKGFMKPPPSLVPLMMMNSDTSTDSSIIATETRRIGWQIKEGSCTNHLASTNQQQVTGNRSGRHYSDVGHANPSQASGYTNKKVSGKRTSESVRTSRRLEENHPSRSDDSLKGKSKGDENKNSTNDNSNKVQMLYYDSDKLIQSIINLTDIHYIDCTNQPARNPSNAATSLGATVTHKDIDSRDRINITNKLDKSNSSCDGNDSATLGAEDELTGVGELEKVGGGAEVMNDQVQVGTGGHTKRIELELSRSSVPRQQRSVGKKLTKLAKERKAAKTLGIVVGVFILCWLPFFVVNIIVALCGMGCIYNPQILLSIVTWLGWLNSAMNPVIYACWSRDFRRAFKRVLCTWVEFLWPYNGARLARKLGLKRSSNYSNTQSTNLNRKASSMKWPATTTTSSTGAAASNRAGASIYEKTTRANGGHRSLLLTSES